MRQTLRCVSLCHPGVHVFLLIIPDAPLNNEDKAEMEEIQRIFSSRIIKHIMILIKQSSEHQTAELNEETQSVIERFGGRHHFFGPKTLVSTLMENIEQMLEENRGEFFSTETFLQAQMKKLMKYKEMKEKINSLETHLLSQGNKKWQRLFTLSANSYRFYLHYVKIARFSAIYTNYQIKIKSLLLSHHHSTSALVSEILMSVLQTVQKTKQKQKTTIYIWTVHIYRLYRRQCAKYTYIYSVHIVYYKDILNYQRHIIHRMCTSTLCTLSIHYVVYT